MDVTDTFPVHKGGRKLEKVSIIDELVLLMGLYTTLSLCIPWCLSLSDLWTTPWCRSSVLLALIRIFPPHSQRQIINLRPSLPNICFYLSFSSVWDKRCVCFTDREIKKRSNVDLCMQCIRAHRCFSRATFWTFQIFRWLSCMRSLYALVKLGSSNLKKYVNFDWIIGLDPCGHQKSRRSPDRDKLWRICVLAQLLAMSSLLSPTLRFCWTPCSIHSHCLPGKSWRQEEYYLWRTVDMRTNLFKIISF